MELAQGAHDGAVQSSGVHEAYQPVASKVIVLQREGEEIAAAFPVPTPSATDARGGQERRAHDREAPDAAGERGGRRACEGVGGVGTRFLRRVGWMCTAVMLG